jgi:elongator complex protein 3
MVIGDVKMKDWLRVVAREVIREIKKGKVKDQKQMNRLKLKIIKKYNYPEIPTNVDIAHFATVAERKKLHSMLSMKPVREMSGVSVIAVMSKPHKCPHGKCIYCGGGVDSIFGDVPQSYTGKEPATRRAIRNDYDPYLQVMNRLEQYVAMNKVPDKAELIVMGGTFPSLSKRYQREFVMYLFKALNDFSELFFDKDKLLLKKFQEFFELPGDIEDADRINRILSKLLAGKRCRKKSLLYEQKRNEKAKIRNVGLTLETRPDYGLKKQGDFMLELGCTKVELGVQTTRDDILKKIERGHDVGVTIRSIRELKDLGFKLNFHFMPGLPGMTKKEMLLDFIELFTNEDFQPDMLKIYPCMVMKGTKLYKMWKGKKYAPLTTADARKLIIKMKQSVPRYSRIMRVQRDIPTYMTEAGVDRTNLRQEIAEEMKKKNLECRCIRCNQIGARKLKSKPNVKALTYHSSNGTEFFLWYGDDKTIIGFCRLRFPSDHTRKEIVEDSALIRELHVYGTPVEIGKTGKDISSQHVGIGKRLMNAAEEICRTYFKNKLLVISAVGTRDYYRKLGYKPDGPYMSKVLK